MRSSDDHTNRVGSFAVSTDTSLLKAAFENVPLFALLPTPSCDALWREARMRAGARGSVIVSQGAQTDQLHVLLSGQATSTTVDRTGRSVSTGRWLAPVVIDKVTMFAETEHPTTVAADTASSWCSLPVAAVQSAIDANPAAQRHALRSLADAASDARRSFVDVAIRPAPTRLARWLVVTSVLGAPIAVPNGQERLAMQLGMTRVTLNRSLHRLADMKLIQVNRSSIAILNLEELRAVADL